MQSGGGAHAAGAQNSGAQNSGTQNSGTQNSGAQNGGVRAASSGPVSRSLEPNRPRQLQYSAPSEGGGVEHRRGSAADPFANVGRNDTCPCGSGRKYKRCHGDPRNA